MSSSNDRRSRRPFPAINTRRSALGYWVPLALTVTVATIGIAAWIWSERQDDDGDENPDYGRDRDENARAAPPPDGSAREPGEGGFGATSQAPEDNTGYMSRMSGALRRTPSPQQFLDGASRTVAAGVAAAGAAVGNALSSIREEDRSAYRDHETWSEEAESRRIQQQGGALSGPTNVNVGPGGGLKRTVAIVVSADLDHNHSSDLGDHHELASILSHLPKDTNASSIRLFVLIYAPDLKEHPLDSHHNPEDSISSSFSNIGHDQLQTSTEALGKGLTSESSPNPVFANLYKEALSLVEKKTMVLPFTSPTGHLHMLRHLNPDIVYLQESLSGENGSAITQLQSWYRHDIVVVVGADGGHGGLADSDSELSAAKPEHWWEREDRVGRGRGVIVVEGNHVGDDWARRVEGKQ